MPYFFNNNINLLLIHIPKTGGTSLEKYFSMKYNIPLNNKSIFGFLDEEIKKNNNIDIPISLTHYTYTNIMLHKNFFNINDNNIEIIAIVRNPYDRIISDLFYNKLINISSTKDEVFNAIHFFLLSNVNFDNHNIPQYTFLINDNFELIPNIKILHTETLKEDMLKLNFKDFDFKENSNNITIDYKFYLNNDSIKLINEFYDNDFRLFNYNKFYTY
jgi:hypothetical protein